MIRDLVGAETFSLFLMDNNVLDASITSNWQGEFTGLLRRYAIALFQHVVGNEMPWPTPITSKYSVVKVYWLHQLLRLLMKCLV